MGDEFYKLRRYSGNVRLVSSGKALRAHRFVQNADPDAHSFSPCDCPVDPCWAFLGKVPRLSGGLSSYPIISIATSGITPCDAGLNFTPSINGIFSVPAQTSNATHYRYGNRPFAGTPVYVSTWTLGASSGNVWIMLSCGENFVPAPFLNYQSRSLYLEIFAEGYGWVFRNWYYANFIAGITGVATTSQRYRTLPNLLNNCLLVPGVIGEIFVGGEPAVCTGGSATVTTAAPILAGNCLPDDSGNYPP